MAPQKFASACWCALFCFVFCLKTVFCDYTRSSLTREELMNIRATTPEELFPTFLPTALEFLDILVKGALTFAHAVKRRKRGKRAFIHRQFCASRRRGCVD
ncbi:hypothetical protein CRENBAI_009412 [Crenichthys baileyi]|uniref:Secreted protein n=1 Tax=Crenichthys baileyi TaxID=28760 RepID=A0AAV9RMJ6_9TELE